MCNFISKVLSFINQRKTRIEDVTESKIEEINKDTNDFLELNKQCSEDDKKKIKKISEKIELSIGENDMASIDSQINDMLSILDEDKEQLIKQKISDNKLKSADLSSAP